MFKIWYNGIYKKLYISIFLFKEINVKPYNSFSIDKKNDKLSIIHIFSFVFNPSISPYGCCMAASYSYTPIHIFDLKF